MFLSYKTSTVWLALAIILTGIILRYYQLNLENYWLDEMLSFWVADPNLTLKETLSRSAYIDQSPPLFNLLLNNLPISIPILFMLRGF